MKKLEEILRNYLNKGSDKIDVTMVLSLIDQCKKYDNKQLLLHNVIKSLPNLKDWDFDIRTGANNARVKYTNEQKRAYCRGYRDCFNKVYRITTGEGNVL